MPSIKCKNCGIEVSYRTKKPTYCKECRPKKYNRRTIHRYERSVFLVIEDVIICDAIRNGYYTWLLSPKGEPMQLDWYANCGVEIGFEIQGEQHYQFNKYFHKTKNNFEYQVTCDQLKESLCKKRGLILFKIRYGTKVNADYVISLLKESKCFNELARRGAINNKYR
jgi:hypothetical protein